MDGLSVVIPTLNRSEYLSATVGKLLTQDFDHPYEIIIVDQSDHIDDHIINLVAAKPQMIKYYFINFFRGLPEARNFGVQYSRYDCILFLDDDIECDNTLLKEHYKYLSRPGIAIVTGGVTEKFRNNEKTRHIGKFHYSIAEPEGGFNINRNGFVDHIKGGNYSIKKSVFIESGGVDEYLNYGAALYEETELALRVKELGYKIYFNYSAHIWHLAAATGGCRVPDIDKYISSLVHNRALIIRRHLKWYNRVTANIYLFKLVCSYVVSYKRLRLLMLFLSAYKIGTKEGRLSPKYTIFTNK